MGRNMLKTLWLVIAVSMLSVGCGRIFVLEPDEDERTCGTQERRMVRQYIAAGGQHFGDADFARSAELYRKAAKLDEQAALRCDMRPLASCCALWLSSLDAAFMGQERGAMRAALEGYLACVEDAPEVVPSARDRVVLNVAAAELGVEVPFGLPHGAIVLEPLIRPAVTTASTDRSVDAARATQ